MLRPDPTNIGSGSDLTLKTGSGKKKTGFEHFLVNRERDVGFGTQPYQTGTLHTHYFSMYQGSKGSRK